MNPGIIICSRSNSTRIPNKPWQTVKGKPIISRLLDQLKGINNIPICVAVPLEDLSQYADRLRDHIRDGILVGGGHDSSPLHRTAYYANSQQIDPIIRITHDKIFVDRFAIREALKLFKSTDIDYLYSSKLVAGSGFEIISRRCLNEAAEKFAEQDIEHISYAVKQVAKKCWDYNPPLSHYNSQYPDIRFLIDFEEDLEFIRAVYDYSISKEPNLSEAIETVEKFPFLKRVNQQPEVTVYTCAYNEQDYIGWCIDSVMKQTIAPRIEYIIIDDNSSDHTYKKILSSKYLKLIKLKRNETNLGLSSSSNIALNLARGKYIMRLDADDALLFPFTLEKMLKEAKQKGFEALYPSYIDQASNACKMGKDSHHVGGCLFLTRAIRHLQFTDKLRGYEGLDLFQRAKDYIKIGYYDDMPAFFYRDKPGSMSKTNLEMRAQIYQKIMGALK
jgi:spore coat polysaccharide biosynthesis protein SpsF (cytidylyltransferase family)